MEMAERSLLVSVSTREMVLHCGMEKVSALKGSSSNHHAEKHIRL